MQVDPVKPKLKPPGTKPLKLKYEKLLSNFAVKFNLSRYSEATSREAVWEARFKVWEAKAEASAAKAVLAEKQLAVHVAKQLAAEAEREATSREAAWEARAYTRPLFSST